MGSIDSSLLWDGFLCCFSEWFLVTTCVHVYSQKQPFSTTVRGMPDPKLNTEKYVSIVYLRVVEWSFLGNGGLEKRGRSNLCCMSGVAGGGKWRKEAGDGNVLCFDWEGSSQMYIYLTKCIKLILF